VRLSSPGKPADVDESPGRPADLDEFLAKLMHATEDEIHEGDRIERMFNVDSSSGDVAGEMDEFALMFKLRKELGDDDFKKIFGSMKVSGPPLEGR